MSDYSTVSVPRQLKEQVEEFIDDTGFQNASEFTRFVLRDIVSQGAVDADAAPAGVNRVRDRLERLGYLDRDDG